MSTDAHDIAAVHLDEVVIGVDGHDDTVAPLERTRVHLGSSPTSSPSPSAPEATAVSR
jgi:hypothetical protein